MRAVSQKANRKTFGMFSPIGMFLFKALRLALKAGLAPVRKLKALITANVFILFFFFFSVNPHLVANRAESQSSRICVLDVTTAWQQWNLKAIMIIRALSSTTRGQTRPGGTSRRKAAAEKCCHRKQSRVYATITLRRNSGFNASRYQNQINQLLLQEIGDQSRRKSSITARVTSYQWKNKVVIFRE